MNLFKQQQLYVSTFTLLSMTWLQDSGINGVSWYSGSLEGIKKQACDPKVNSWNPWMEWNNVGVHTTAPEQDTSVPKSCTFSIQASAYFKQMAWHRVEQRLTHCNPFSNGGIAIREVVRCRQEEAMTVDFSPRLQVWPFSTGTNTLDVVGHHLFETYWDG